MVLDWVISTTIEMSLLTGIVLMIRPFVLRLFGANVSYSLWLIPLLGILLPSRLTRPELQWDVAPAVLTVGSRGALSEAYSVANDFIAPLGSSWAWFWLFGMAVWLAIQFHRSVLLHARVRRTAFPIGNLPDGAHGLLKKYGFEQARIFTTEHEGAPFVAGLISPKIFLPLDYRERFSDRDLSWVLRHELMHIYRKDIWLRFVAEGIRALYWFNPLAHLAASTFRKDQEYACDLAVVGSCSPIQRYHYGKALLSSVTEQHMRVSLTFFGNRKERYNMLGRHRKSSYRFLLGSGICALVGAFSLAATSVGPICIPIC